MANEATEMLEATKRLFTDETGQRIAGALEEIALGGAGSAATLDAAVVAMIDGTNTTQVFKAWYNRAAVLSGEAPNRWNLLTRFAGLVAEAWDGKVYTLRSALASLSGSTDMTPLDDLAAKQSGGQLAIETDTEDPDDWTKEDPMTWYIRANALSLADGTMNITAIEGIDDDFDITGEDAPVWTFALSLYVKEWSDAAYDYISFRTTAADGYAADAADIGPDSVRRALTWHPTFPGGVNSAGALTSGAGRAPYTSHSALQGIAAARLMDPYEGLWSDCDTRWLLRMWQLRHWNLENSGIAEGCTNYSLDYTPAVAESGVKRVLLTTAQAAAFIVGSTVMLSASARGGAVTVAAAKIESIETVTVEGSSYGAINLDVESTFSTTTSLHLCTIPYHSGATEALPGHADGCFGGSLTSGKGPLRVAGVEVLEGAYALGLDPLYNVTAGSASGKFNYAIYECKDSEKQAGSITSDYEDTGISFTDMPNAWNYVKKFFRTVKGVLFPELIGGSSTTYLKSAFAGTGSAGVRSPWRFCYLNSGGNAGLAGEHGSNTPSGSGWHGRPRLGGAGKKRG